MQLDFISARGDVLPLVNNKYFVITNVDGMTAATTSLSSNVVSGLDGDTVNNAQAQPRGIVFDLRIRPEVNVEEAKREILRVVKLKQNGALIWTQNERTVTISGIVGTVDMPRWNEAVTMQISLYCSQPFWEDLEFVVSRISEEIDLHYFTENYTDMLYFPAEGLAFGEIDTIRTKQFYNSGDVSIGLEITIVALDTVTNPIIYDQNGNFFGVGYDSRPVVMQAGDAIKISTVRKQKSVTMNGVNLLDKIRPLSVWLQLETGDNMFTINSSDESISNMNFNIQYKQRYI